MKVTIGLAEAKAQLSKVLDRVEAGETIVIARSGKPIAEIRPLKPPSAAETVKKIQAIAERVAKRNKGKDVWAPGGREFRQMIHDRHRF